MKKTTTKKQITSNRCISVQHLERKQFTPACVWVACSSCGLCIWQFQWAFCIPAKAIVWKSITWYCWLFSVITYNISEKNFSSGNSLESKCMWLQSQRDRTNLTSMQRRARGGKNPFMSKKAIRVELLGATCSGYMNWRYKMFGHGSSRYAWCTSKTKASHQLRRRVKEMLRVGLLHSLRAWADCSHWFTYESNRARITACMKRTCKWDNIICAHVRNNWCKEKKSQGFEMILI